MGLKNNQSAVKIRFKSILLFLIFFSVVYADAIVTMSNYSITPSSVKPGVVGSAVVVLTNEGNTVANDISLIYGLLDQTPWTGGSIAVGDLSPGTSTSVVIPFKVPSTYTSGMASLPFMIFYGSANSAKFAIPITISNPPNILITNKLSKASLIPGESFDIYLNVTNLGGDARDLSITIPSNSSFQLNKISKYQYSFLNSNSSVEFVLSILANSNAASGSYDIPLQFSYLDQSGETVSETINVGPIAVSDISSIYRVKGVKMNSATPGSALKLNVSLSNYGSIAKDISIEIGSSSYLVPIDSSVIYFDDVLPGTESSQIISIGVDPSASLGYYSLPLKVKLSNGQSFNTTIGIQIEGHSDLKIGYNTNPTLLGPGTAADLTLDISNVGDSGIRSASVSLYSDEIQFSGTSSGFLGTINIDETSVFTTSIRVPNNVSPGSKDIFANITFKDSGNKEHTITKKISLLVSSQQSVPASSTNVRPNTSAKQNNFMNLLPIAIGGVILIIILYFGYKWWTGKKKKKHDAKEELK